MKAFVRSEIVGIESLVKYLDRHSEPVVEGAGRQGRASISEVDTYEFRNSNVQQVRIYFDRLLIAKQVKGTLPTGIVTPVVDRMEKGLH